MWLVLFGYSFRWLYIIPEKVSDRKSFNLILSFKRKSRRTIGFINHGLAPTIEMNEGTLLFKINVNYSGLAPEK